MANVQYRSIDGIPGYRVGNDGSVWSSKIIGANGRTGPWWQMLLHTNKSGHQQVTFCNDGVSCRFYVHHLVLECFGSPRPAGMECRHLDGNPANNNRRNLKWGTDQENCDDMLIHGTRRIGSRHHKAKLNENSVAVIKKRLKEGENYRLIAKQYSVARETIQDIKHGRRWRHVA